MEMVIEKYIKNKLIFEEYLNDENSVRKKKLYIKRN